MWVLAVLILYHPAGSTEALWNLPRLTALFEITSMIQTSLGVAYASLIGGVTRSVSPPTRHSSQSVHPKNYRLDR